MASKDIIRTSSLNWMVKDPGKENTLLHLLSGERLSNKIISLKVYWPTLFSRIVFRKALPIFVLGLPFFHGFIADAPTYQE